jgi:hypothetical protein
MCSLLATTSIAQQRPPMARKQKAAVARQHNDSVALRRQAISFIKKVKGYTLAASQFRLENQPASLKQSNCLQAVLADNKTLTPAELKAIEVAATYKAARWSATEFANTTLLEADTINAIFENRYKGWTHFREHIGRDFYEFSFPIFIRNGTYCLFYTAMYCGELCAEGNLILYKKSGTNWVEMKRYCIWVS